MARLNRAGYRVVVATNQSGIGRGLLDMLMLNRIHQKCMRQRNRPGATIDAVFFCPHYQKMIAAVANQKRGCCKRFPSVLIPLYTACLWWRFRPRSASRAGNGLQTLSGIDWQRPENPTATGFPEQTRSCPDLAAVVEDLLG